jgi:CBS domain containing-hemolysin-like protein
VKGVPIDTALGLSALVALLLVTAVFVAGEFALVAADRSRIDLVASRGSRRGRIALALLDRLAFALSGTQLGITLCTLGLGVLTEPVLARALRAPVANVVGERSAHGFAVAAALALMTVAQMVVSELIPKNVAVARPETTALALGPLLRLYGIVFGPVIALLDGAAGAAVRRLGVQRRETHDSAPSAVELASLIELSGRHGSIDPESSRLLARSLRFGGKSADDVLVPRLAMVSIDADATVAELAGLAVRSGFSRFPVCEGDLDHVVGVALAKDVLRVPVAERAVQSVRSLTVPVMAVPVTRDLESLLAEIRAGGGQLVVVLDEFGATAGMLTLEDVLEELVGEIDDEYDDPPRFTVLPAGAVALDGTIHRDDVSEALGLLLPDGDFETLAGFVLELFDRIPQVGEQVSWQGWEFEVLEMDRRRIARIGVARIEPA